MEQIITNKADWTGEEGTIKLLGQGRFTICDIDGTFVLDQPFDEKSVYEVRRGSQSWYGFRTKGLVYFKSCGCEREDKNALVAFAQMAWNTF